MSYPSEHISQHADLFKKKLNQADSFLTQWQDIKTAVAAIPDNGYHTKLAATDKIIETAITDFKYKLAHPTLTLAVTGTTSSGKSSLINLLCGADIMPCFEKETSAGIVTIHHSSKQCKLVIHKTKGATWHCGSWIDLDDKEIKAKLTECMETYNKHRADDNPPEFPKIDLSYPIACFTDKTLLGLQGLPDSTQFKLLDLPGLKNVTDTLNTEVIQHCKEALCLVTYNMAETDDTKREALVKEVLGQVRLMGGSPNRMVFVLNRIDTFDKDDDAERIKTEQMSIVLKEIKTILGESLPQFQHQIKTLSYSRLSSKPSLYAYWLQATHPRKQYAASQLDNDFKRLTPAKDEFKKRSIRLDESEDWQADDFTWVRDHVWKTSHARDFFQVLDDHIEAHFATLVLPPMLADLQGKINGLTGEWLRLANAEIIETEEGCQKALSELESTSMRLEHLLDTASAALVNGLDDEDLEQSCYQLLKNAPYQQLSIDTLHPLYSWRSDSKKVMQSIIDGAIKFLKTADHSGTEMDRLPAILHKRLEEDCKAFKNSNYPLQGSTMSKSWNDEELKKYSKSLADFSIALSTVITEYFDKRIFPQQLERIKEALNTLLNQHLHFLQENINEIAPNWGLSLLPKTLLASLLSTLFPSISNKKIDFQPVNDVIKLDFCLEADFDTVIEERRNPLLLFIFKWDVECAAIPSVDTLVDLFVEQLKKESQRIEPLMTQQIQQLFEQLNRNILCEQQRVKDSFEANYQQRRKEIERGKQSEQAPWQALLPVITDWKVHIANMTDMQKLE